jgi:hypothetical protein
MERTARAASVSELMSSLPRSTFLNDFGSETLLSLPIGRRFWLRLFSATPPATPARAAPPASSGVFAFEASSATLPPVLAIAPSDDPRLVAEVVVLRPVDLLLLRAVPDRLPFEVVRLELDRAVLDDPFPLVDLFVLEPLDELRLEDRVVCAIVLASLGFRASSAVRAGGLSALPTVVRV